MKDYVDFIPEGFEFVAPERPQIIANHIDGPVIHFRDGQMHWLTLWERLLFWLGMTDAVRIEQRRRPNLCRLLQGEMIKPPSAP